MVSDFNSKKTEITNIFDIFNFSEEPEVFEVHVVRSEVHRDKEGGVRAAVTMVTT